MDEHRDSAEATRHEGHDVSIRSIVRFGIGLTIAAVVIHVGIWLLFRFFERYAEKRDAPPSSLSARRPVEAPRNPEKLFPEPRLERFPFATRESLRREEDSRLLGYGWVDRGSGVVRIPIERAMDLIAVRGLPPATGSAPPPAVPAAAAPRSGS
ncbi:MAG: hypothetical protein ABR576_15080 [Thermoanaerobaculia bacterium]